MDDRPEVNLLDHLIGRNESLALAAAIFGEESAVEEGELPGHARRAIWFMIEDGLVELLKDSEGDETVVPTWAVREVLGDVTNWARTPGGAATYVLSLTGKGAAFTEEH